MVRWRLRLRAGSGGGVRPIMVLSGTSWVIMVAYIPPTIAAAVGSMYAVSRLHKLIPVYSFYSYWGIKTRNFDLLNSSSNHKTF